MIANDSVTPDECPVRQNHIGTPIRLFVFRIHLDGMWTGAVRAMWQGQILDVPFFAVQLLNEVVLEVAAAMKRERLHGRQRP